MEREPPSPNKSFLIPIPILQVILILILINIQYLQSVFLALIKCAFSFDKVFPFPLHSPFHFYPLLLFGKSSLLCVIFYIVILYICILKKYCYIIYMYIKTIFWIDFFFHQMIALQKVFFILSKKLFSFLIYSNFCIFPCPDKTGQMEVE